MSINRLAKAEAGLRVGLAFQDACNRQDLDALLRLLSGDCRLECPAPAPAGRVCVGREEVSRFWQECFQNSPAAGRQIEEAYGLGERCVLRWRCERLDPTGTPVTLRGVDLIRLRDGLICELFSYVKGDD